MHIETREIGEIQFQFQFISCLHSIANPSTFCIFISGLKLGKACGPYSIPVSVLKTLNIVISKPLQILYNLCFASGVVPDAFKIARVIPIFKSGSHFYVSNFRPISLLSIFNQILERLMYNRLVKFLDKYYLLYNSQFEFRAVHLRPLSTLRPVFRYF